MSMIREFCEVGIVIKKGKLEYFKDIEEAIYCNSNDGEIKLKEGERNVNLKKLKGLAKSFAIKYECPNNSLEDKITRKFNYGDFHGVKKYLFKLEERFTRKNIYLTSLRSAEVTNLLNYEKDIFDKVCKLWSNDQELLPWIGSVIKNQYDASVALNFMLNKYDETSYNRLCCLRIAIYAYTIGEFSTSDKFCRMIVKRDPHDYELINLYAKVCISKRKYAKYLLLKAMQLQKNLPEKSIMHLILRFLNKEV